MSNPTRVKGNLGLAPIVIILSITTLIVLIYGLEEEYGSLYFILFGANIMSIATLIKDRPRDCKYCNNKGWVTGNGTDNLEFYCKSCDRNFMRHCTYRNKKKK